MRCRWLLVPVLLLAACTDDDGGTPGVIGEALPRLIAEVDLTTQTGTASAVDWSTDGATIAVAAGAEVILSYADLEPIATVAPTIEALVAAPAPDGVKYATVGGQDNALITVWRWDPDTLRFAIDQQLDGRAEQHAVSWSPNGRLLASLAGGSDSTIQIWDTLAWRLLGEYDVPYTNSRRSLTWSDDSTTVFDAGEVDGEAGYFAIDAGDGTVTELGRLPSELMVAFTMSADGSLIAVADLDGKVRIFEVGSTTPLTEFAAVADPVDLVWDPHDDVLAVLGHDATLQLWSLT